MKYKVDMPDYITEESPSAWRAWIEMISVCMAAIASDSRPPHGGRGLKYRLKRAQRDIYSRPPHGGRGLKYIPFILILSLFKVALRMEGVD